MKRQLRNVARELYMKVDPVNVMVYRMLHREVQAIPPALNRIRVGSRSISRFMEAGRNCYEPIKHAVDKYALRNGHAPRVLDFGCGVGRVLQYFAREDFEIHGCDVDATAIDYMRRAYPSVPTEVNNYEPPLPYPDGKFDIVYSVSIWTHLPPEGQIPWLLEMDRILAPGGLALLTTIGPYGYRRGTHLWAVKFSLDDLIRDGLRYSDYENKGPGTGPSYGAAYHTPAYVMQEWGKYFDLIEVQEGVIDNLNDLVVMRKRAAA